MAFHLLNELPVKPVKVLDESLPRLTEEELRIIKDQIKKNSQLIQHYILRLDLFVNHERHPSREPLLDTLRQRVQVLMNENDTFRAVLWKHCLAMDARTPIKKHE